VTPREQAALAVAHAEAALLDARKALRESERVIVRATIDAARTAFYQPCVERSVSAQADLDSAAMDVLDALVDGCSR